MKRIFAMMAALALAGCEKADNAPGPGDVTMGEARALDEAAQMLESRRPPPDLAPDPVPGVPDGAPSDAEAGTP